MAAIITSTTLDRLTCPASAVDTQKQRHAHTGPARQGQAFHRLVEAYIRHLVKTDQASDFDEGAALWGRLRGLLSVEDDVGIEACWRRFVQAEDFSWILGATDMQLEHATFRTLEGAVVDPERVHDLRVPLFRSQPDLAWEGQGPRPYDGDAVRHVLDWKTSWSRETVEHPSKNRQLARYAACHWGWDEPVQVWLWFPRIGWVEGARLEADQLRAAWEELVVEPSRALLTWVERAPEERVTGAHCARCDLRLGCDAYLRHPSTVLSLAGASREDRLVALHLARQVAKDLEAAVVDDFSTGGPVDAPGVRSYLKTTTTTEYDPTVVRSVLAEAIPDEHAALAFSVTKTSLTRALREGGVKGKARASLLERAAEGAIVKTRVKVTVEAVKARTVPDGAGADEEVVEHDEVEA